MVYLKSVENVITLGKLIGLLSVLGRSTLVLVLKYTQVEFLLYLYLYLILF